MRHYLIVYDRDEGEIAFLRRYDSKNGSAPIEERFELEKVYPPSGRYEVVVLGASSLEQCRKTHGRYFLTLAELAARAGP